MLTKRTKYVGGAHEYVFFPGVYPMETEFLHTVRYLGFGEDGGIVNSRCMKEVRYLKKCRGDEGHGRYENDR